MNVTHLAIGLFNATWQSAALILATALGLRACRSVGARARCILWSAVFFLSALLPIADLAMQRTFVVAPPGPAALPARATALSIPAHRAPQRGVTARSETATKAAAAMAPEPAAPQRAENPFLAPQRALQSLAGVLLALYALGAAFFGLRLARECFTLLAMKRRCTILDDGSALSGPLPRGARLATSAEIAIPCVLGFGRPLVVLPCDMLEQVAHADLRRVVAHEAAHLERFDDWTNLLEQLVLAAFFYNPAMHFAVRQIATEREIACDDHVVLHEGDTVTYAECLATLVHRAGATRRLPVPGFHAGPRQIVVRIERLLDRAYSRSRRFGAGIAMTAGAVVLLAVTGVGNTVPVIADAVPAPPAVPALPALPKDAPAPAHVRKITLVLPGAPAPAKLPPLAKVPAPPALATLPKPALPAAPQGEKIVVVRVATATSQETNREMQTNEELRMSIGQTVAPVAPRHRGDSLIDALSASGYGRLSVDELVGLSDSGITGTAVREYAQLFGHPAVDELKALADHGVTPGYVARVEAAGLHGLTVRDAIRLADNGISSRDVANAARILKAPPSVDDIIRLRNSGVQ
jgi:beta-lactamase regulating signal transducer with metallopeptidase domain